MNVFLWLFDRLCAVLADIGTLCLIVLLVAGDGMTAFVICTAIGVPCAAVGGFVGSRIWHYGIAPFTLFFRNKLQLGESLASMVTVWAVRFFLFPFIAAGVYYVLA
ncbi:MAG: hypothetical protein J6Y00_07575 [Paludibacteraceae bacterium]|nr:hypothetical protein [Paludibacteraceae bacterium]